MTDDIYNTQDLKAGDMVHWLGRDKDIALVTSVTEDEYEEVNLTECKLYKLLHEKMDSACYAIYRDGAKIFGDEKANELWLKDVLTGED